MDNEILKLYKNIGETPLECIERFRVEHEVYQKTPMTYLGRLDPMAEGVLLVLAGNTKDKKKYLEWDKEYEFEVLWGFETDTYDILGLVTATGPTPQKLDFKIKKLLENISSRKTQSYPPYSSKTVGGKALHTWAREGRIDEIEIPTRGIKIFSIEHTDTRLVSGGEILEKILAKIDLVKGNFRQEEVMREWKEAFESQRRDTNNDFLISGFKASVSTGTYIRCLAHEMGHILNTCALAYSIKRIRVGEYHIDS